MEVLEYFPRLSQHSTLSLKSKGKLTTYSPALGPLAFLGPISHLPLGYNVGCRALLGRSHAHEWRAMVTRALLSQPFPSVVTQAYKPALRGLHTPIMSGHGWDLFKNTHCFDNAT